MTLKHPYSEVDFNVNASFCLGGFNVYDREESLGEYLDQFDPNDYEQLSILLDERLFESRMKNGYLPEHKKVIMNVLKEALIDEDYDFEAILQDDDDHYFCLPWDWIIENPRGFFEFVYLKMYEYWSEELISEGFDVKKPEEVF